MKLIPKAKPVRIRIKSGGVECKDLNDLRRSFNVDDLKKIEQRQLVKWLDQVDGGAAIARELDYIEGLNGNLKTLKYYQVFFRIHDNDLFKIWKYLKAKGFNKSADILGDQLLGEGDSRVIIENMSNKNDLEKCHFILNSSDSSIRINSKLFLEIGERVSKLRGDKGEIGQEVLSRLAALGIKEAEQNLLLTPQEFMSLLDSFFEGKTSDFEVAINNNLGKRVNMLGRTLRNFAEGVFLGFVRHRPIPAINALSNNAIDYASYSAIEGYVHDKNNWKHLSFERLFALALLISKVNQRSDNEIFRYLKDSNYIFAKGNDFYEFPQSYSNSFSKDILLLYKGHYFPCIHSKRGIPPDIYDHFVRLYFRHFLEPQYYHGDLSNI